MTARVALVQPLYGHIPPSAVISTQRLIADGVVAAMRTGSGIWHIDHEKGTYLSHACNSLVRKTLAHPADLTHVLFVEQDMEVPKDALDRLLAHEQLVVGATYFLKDEPWTPVAYNFHPDFYLLPKLPRRRLARVGGIGLGCTLIDVEVFRKMEAHFGDQLWFFTSETMGQDVWFAQRLREIGVPVHLDTTLRCRHVGDAAIGYEQYAYALGQRQSRGDVRREDVMHGKNRGRR